MLWPPLRVRFLYETQYFMGGSAAEDLQVTGSPVPIRPSLDPQGSDMLVVVTTRQPRMTLFNVRGKR